MLPFGTCITRVYANAASEIRQIQCMVSEPAAMEEPVVSSEMAQRDLLHDGTFLSSLSTQESWMSTPLPTTRRAEADVTG